MACGSGCDCHCCAGIDAATPRRAGNPPGLPAIAYRAGRHADFMESLTARLSSAEYPALAELTTREPSDATIALLDGLAASLDVLSFYAERTANETYLRTATERLSVLEMARLIGYEPAPGVAAATHLAFTLQELPGAAAGPVTIPVGTKVQSVPGDGETAQTFETVAPAPAQVEWNAIPLLAARAWVPEIGDTELWLDGVATGLEPGSAILIVGLERKRDPGNENWDVRVVSAVDPDPERSRTRVRWAHPLGSIVPQKSPAQEAPEVHAFRQRAALFGHNAPDPNLFSKEGGSNIREKIDIGSSPWKWKGFAVDTTIDIDPANPKIVAGTWVALVSNEQGSGSADLPGYTELYRAAAVAQRTQQAFAVSAKISRVTPDTTENLTSARFDLRRTLVLAQSERLATVDTPLIHPVHGDRLTLGRRVEGLAPGRAIALSGKRQPLVVVPGATGLNLMVDGAAPVSLAGGDRLFMVAPAARVAGTAAVALAAEDLAAQLGNAGATLRLRLLDRGGRTGNLVAPATALALAPSEKADPEVAEIVVIAGGIDAIALGRDTTDIRLHEATANVYERATARVNANVAPATHGETVEAILGDGDGRQPNQHFALNQKPLTYVGAATPSGRASTLEVRINGVLWSEVASLYGAEPAARVYETVATDDGVTTVQFGDGVDGARLPSGSTNVRTRYRKGLGAAGNVADGKITTLLSRPLGVAGAVNPGPATGGEEPEPLDRARDNAPLTTLTLDRVVSIVDYANLARGFAGIDEAHALWIPSGPARGVFLTVAGVDGAALPEASATYGNLLAALATYGDPLVPIRVVSYANARVRLSAALKVDPAHDEAVTRTAVEAALRSRFGFAARSFGQTVSVDEVAAAAQAVAGVEAVHVRQLYRAGAPPALNPRLFARLPVASLTSLPQPAELLTLADDPVALDILP